jgi:Uma2 family endonuclease
VTALPEPSRPAPLIQPSHLLTVAEYAALDPTEPGYTELVEGRLLMSPSPKPRHNIASARLAAQVMAQLPAGLEAVPDIDVDLELAPGDRPGFVRRPDLVVVEQAAVDRVEAEGGLFRAVEVLVVVEIVSPGSVRTDNVTKRGEYADAGIPHYWIVDLAVPVSLVACHLAGEFGYQDPGAATGELHLDDPFPVTLRLDVLA